MFPNLSLSKREYKALNRLLESVNFSFEVLAGQKWRRIYGILKRAKSLLNWDELNNKDLKLVAKALSSNVAVTKRERREALALITYIENKTKVSITEPVVASSLNEEVEWFFDLKQVVRC